MAKVARVLKSGGKFHAATDWEHYAFWMLEVLDGMPEFINSCERVTLRHALTFAL